MDNWLKRFDYLELGDEVKGEQGWLLSKRRLLVETQDEKVEVVISDQITPTLARTAPHDIELMFCCHFCGMDNTPNELKCSGCGKPLEKQLTEEETGIDQILKCSSCEADNDAKKSNCWVCGIYFPADGPQSERDCTNLITIDYMQGHYTSADKRLPKEVTYLIKKIRKAGLSQEIVGQWIVKKNQYLAQVKRIEDRSKEFGDKAMEMINNYKGYLLVAAILLLMFLVAR